MVIKDRNKEKYDNRSRQAYRELVHQLSNQKMKSNVLTLHDWQMEKIAQLVYKREGLTEGDIQRKHRRYLQRTIPAALVHAVKQKCKATRQQHILVATIGKKFNRASQKLNLQFQFQLLDPFERGYVTVKDVADLIPFTLQVKSRQFSSGWKVCYPDVKANKKWFLHSTGNIKLEYGQNPPAGGMPVKCVSACPLMLMVGFDNLPETPMPNPQSTVFVVQGMEVVFTVVVCKQHVEQQFGDQLLEEQPFNVWSSPTPELLQGQSISEQPLDGACTIDVDTYAYNVVSETVTTNPLQADLTNSEHHSASKVTTKSNDTAGDPMTIVDVQDCGERLARQPSDGCLNYLQSVSSEDFQDFFEDLLDDTPFDAPYPAPNVNCNNYRTVQQPFQES